MTFCDPGAAHAAGGHGRRAHPEVEELVLQSLAQNPKLNPKP